MSPFEEHQIRPDWIVRFFEIMQEAFTSLGPTAGIGYRHVRLADGSHVLFVFQSMGEILGGKGDGTRVYSGLQIDLGKIMEAFSQIDFLGWHCPAVYASPEEGPQIRITGTIFDVPVTVRILSQPLADAELTMKVDSVTGEVIRD